MSKKLSMHKPLSKLTLNQTHAEFAIVVYRK